MYGRREFVQDDTYSALFEKQVSGDHRSVDNMYNHGQAVLRHYGTAIHELHKGEREKNVGLKQRAFRGIILPRKTYRAEESEEEVMQMPTVKHIFQVSQTWRCHGWKAIG